jgi:hypothetical protein
VDRHARVRLAREPRRDRAVLRDSGPCAPTRWSSGRARCGRGFARRPPSSTSRSLFPRCAPTARRPSSRTAGCAATAESSIAARALCSSRCRACAEPMRRRFPGPFRRGRRAALLPGPRLPDRLSHPRHDRRARG